jgi:hypothetical protein
MPELNWTLSWTLVTIGLCWLFVSCAVALALGRIIQRSKASAAASNESEGHIDDVGVEDESGLEDGGSRAASGTRMKPVWLEDEAAPKKRKVS